MDINARCKQARIAHVARVANLKRSVTREAVILPLRKESVAVLSV